MGKRIKTISDEMLVANGVHQLDPEVLVTTAQAAMLLGCSVSGMAELKRAGRPPPARQPGGRGSKVSYQLGDVLLARRAPQAPSNLAARKAHDDHIRGFPTFAAFMAEGHARDEWPFAMEAGRPIDFFRSLGASTLSVSECGWFSMGRYLEELSAAALRAEASVSNENMERKTGPALGETREPKRL